MLRCNWVANHTQPPPPFPVVPEETADTAGKTLPEPNRPSVNSLKAFRSQRGSQPDSSPPQISSFKDSVLWFPIMSHRSSSPSSSFCLSFSLSITHLLTSLLVWWVKRFCPSEPYLRRTPNFPSRRVIIWWLCGVNVLLGFFPRSQIWRRRLSPHSPITRPYRRLSQHSQFELLNSGAPQGLKSVCLQDGGI